MALTPASECADDRAAKDCATASRKNLLRRFLRLGSLRGPASALCIRNALACFRAEVALFARCRGSPGSEAVQFVCYLAGAREQSADLSQPCNFSIDFCENRMIHHRLRITHFSRFCRSD